MVDPRRQAPHSGRRMSTRERIDYGFTIGTFVAPDGRALPTSVGVIHSHRDGSVHIVPGEPPSAEAAGAPSRNEVFLSMPRALHDIPTPELRFITLAVRDGRVTGRFGYDVPVDDHISDLVALAETYVHADFVSRAGVSVAFWPDHVPQSEPRALFEGEEWFYLRYEPPGDD